MMTLVPATRMVRTLAILAALLLGGSALAAPEPALDPDPELQRSLDRKSTRLNSSHIQKSRMPSSA